MRPATVIAQEAERPRGNDPTLEEWEVPYAQSRPRDPYVAPDGRVWFVGQRSHYAAVLAPATGDIEIFPMPDERARDPHTFVGFDTRTEEYISEVDVASGGGTIRHMYYDPRTDVVWFGTDVNTVGRAVLPPRRSVSE